MRISLIADSELPVPPCLYGGYRADSEYAGARAIEREGFPGKDWVALEVFGSKSKSAMCGLIHKLHLSLHHGAGEPRPTLRESQSRSGAWRSTGPRRGLLKISIL